LPKPTPSAARPSLGAAALVGLIAVAVVLSLPGLAGYNPVLRAQARHASPRVEADLQAVADHLSARLPTGRVFSRLEWGEYLAWSLAPQFRVFMDGRIEIYPDDVWAQYAAVTSGRANWEELLDRYQVDALVLD